MSSDSEKEAVRALGARIGYGAMMQLAERCWGDMLEAEGLPRGGAHAAYCCTTFLVPCPGCTRHKCDWCCGAGRVTKRVAEARKELEALQAKIATAIESDPTCDPETVRKFLERK